VQYRDCYKAARSSFLQIYLVKLFVLAISEPSNILSNLYATGRGRKYSNYTWNNKCSWIVDPLQTS